MGMEEIKQRGLVKLCVDEVTQSECGGVSKGRDAKEEEGNESGCKERKRVQHWSRSADKKRL